MNYSGLQYQESVFVGAICGPIHTAVSTKFFVAVLEIPFHTAVSTKFVVTVLEILSPPDLLTDKKCIFKTSKQVLMLQNIILFLNLSRMLHQYL